MDRNPLTAPRTSTAAARTSSTVAVLFARRDSVYKTLRGVDVWDELRDARTWPGGSPLIAHPPCRAWGGLRHLAKPQPGERELAIFALDQVRRWGGVLEHPRRSELWPTFNLPVGDAVDEYGGYSLLVNQTWWGHLAEKPSLLYVCGVPRSRVPPVRVDLTAPSHIVAGQGRRDDFKSIGWRPDLSRRLREGTPRAFALWLIRLARAAAGEARRLEQHGTTEHLVEHGELDTAHQVDTAAASEHGRGAHGPGSTARSTNTAAHGRLQHRDPLLDVSQLATSTYRHRADPNARRDYMRDLMRTRRAARHGT